VAEAKRLISAWEAASPVQDEDSPATTTSAVAAAPRDDEIPVRPKRLGRDAFMFGLGAVLAATAFALYFRSPFTPTGTDYDGDGHTEERHIYRGDALIRSEWDRNGDRKADVLYDYDQRGVVRTGQSDDDFDGRYETQMTFRFGQPADTSIDRDGDGFSDEVVRFASGIPTEYDYLGGGGRRILVKRIVMKPGGVVDFALLDTDRDGVFDVRDDYDELGESRQKSAIAPGTPPRP
jgi:hypothetical protein